jgi:hypothetical protein
MNKDEQDKQDRILVHHGHRYAAGSLIIVTPPLASQGMGHPA